MAWPVYSHRLVQSAGGGVWIYFTVPPNQRAVVKEIIVNNVSSAAAGGYVLLGGKYIWSGSLPGGSRTLHEPTMAVAYAGEQIGCVGGISEVGITVCGFLFADPFARMSKPANEEGDPPDGWYDLTQEAA